MFNINRSFVLAMMLRKIIFTGCALFLIAHTAISESYNFSIPLSVSAPGAVDMTARTHDAPAGKYGQIINQSGRLVFEDTGASARLWGVGMALQTGFPPEGATERQAIVDQLSSFGINHVRLVAMDYLSRGFYDEWRVNRDFDFEWMDTLDQFLSELKDAGIYYSLSLNHLSDKLRLDGVPPSGFPSGNKSRNNLQLYNSLALDLQAELFYSLMSHTNQYTGLAYAVDPAMVYIEAVNEDSIFVPFFSGTTGRLTSSNIVELTSYYNSYLSTNYASRTALETAWAQAGKIGLQAGESWDDQNIQLIFPIDAAGAYSQARVHDQLRFFNWVETRHAQKMKAALNQAAQENGEAEFKGLFTASNNWYGQGAMKTTQDSGNYLDMHGYVDPQRKVDHDGDSNTPEVMGTRNNSVLRHPVEAWSNPFDVVWDSSHLLRLACAGLDGIPMVFSEWNSNLWNPKAYETPLLMTAYAAFQGWDVMDVHTYLSTATSPLDTRYMNHSYNSGVNPMFMALAPSLSLAFSRGDIDSPDPVVFSMAPDEAGFWDVVLDSELNVNNGRTDVPPTLGFMYKARRKLFDSGSYALPSGMISDFNQATVNKSWKTQPAEEIEWNWNTLQDAYLKVDTPRFQAISGGGLNPVDTTDLTMQFTNGVGTLTVISLDDQPLSVSGSMLVTVAGHAHNTGEQLSGPITIGTWTDGLAVTDIGNSPMQLERVKGMLTVKGRNPADIQAYSVALNGAMVPIVLDGDGTIPLGENDSPWILLTVDSDAATGFFEDWLTLDNGSGSDLSAVDANLAEWTFNPSAVGYYKEQNGELLSKSGAGALNSKTAGKVHGQVSGGVVALDLSFDLNMYMGSGATLPGSSEVWLSDAYQNGYGLQLIRSSAAAASTLQITKFSEGTGVFGTTRNATQTLLGSSAAYTTGGVNGFRRLHLKLEQLTAGSDVVLTAWADGSSYESPLVTFTDSSSPIDLYSMGYVALALDRSNSSGGGVLLDNITLFADLGLATNNTPISWLQDYGYTNNYDTAALDDPDGDGLENWEEYHTDTNPTNSESFLQVAISATSITFDTSAVVSYDVEGSDNLISNVWTTLTNISGSGSSAGFMETNNFPVRYYRLKAERK